MSQLVNLPDEVLANILNRKAASDMVVSLWLCGCPALNIRLSRRGCISFVAKVKRARKWPRILSELKSLRRVVFYADLMLESLTMIAIEVRKLPSQLEEVRLNLPDASLLLFDSRPFLGATDPMDQIRHFNTKDPISWPLHHAYPCLKTLQLEKLGSHLLALFLSEAVINLLPSGLSKLDLRGMKFVGELPSLPQSLTALGFDFLKLTHFNNLTYAGLPPNLRKMSCDSVPTNKIASLPRSLTRGTLNFSGALGPSTTLEIPRGLLEATVRDIGWDFLDSDEPRWTSLLPSRLTKLTAYVGFELDEIPHLPRTLLHIMCARIHGKAKDVKDYLEEAGDEFNSEDFWPPSLLSICFFRGERAQDELFYEPRIPLPRSLRLLDVSGLEPSKKRNFFENAAPLPPALTRLKVANHTDNTPLVSCTIDMPASLTFFKATGVHIKSSIANLLTTNLKTLILSDTSADTDHWETAISSLPQTLEKLHFSTIKTSSLSHLPRGLKCLKCSHFKGIVGPDSLQGLPPALTRLKVWRLLSNTHYPAFASLPPSLRVLQFFRNREIDLRLFRYLAPTIRHVYFSTVINVTSDTVAALPLHWVSWILQHVQLKEKDANMLFEAGPLKGSRFPTQTWVPS